MKNDKWGTKMAHRFNGCLVSGTLLVWAIAESQAQGRVIFRDDFNGAALEPGWAVSSSPQEAQGEAVVKDGKVIQISNEIGPNPAQSIILDAIQVEIVPSSPSVTSER